MGIPFFLPREEDTETLLLPLGEAWKELYLPLGRVVKIILYLP